MIVTILSCTLRYHWRGVNAFSPDYRIYLFMYLLIYFKKDKFFFTAYTSCEFMSLLPQPLRCWDYRVEPLSS